LPQEVAVSSTAKLFVRGDDQTWGVEFLSVENYQTVAKVGEIVEGRGLSVDIEGMLIAVFLEGGQYYAIDDVCPHQGAPLSDGIVFDKSVTCSWHGWRFSLENGCWLDSPRSRTRVGTYPVRVVDDEIQVSVS
jgi:nitrite reductase (NADH) small subunit/3-phenylpropionate/trans-cinnamate dioxygenase ferredoxin subunit